MDQRTKLCIVHSDGGAETDYSMEAQDFKRDSFTVQMTTDDFIYVGFKKLINALYFHILTPNAVTSSLTLEYYSNTGWKTLDMCDETNAFSRSGFMTWERPTDGANVTVAGKELCWFRIATNDDIDPVEFQAINLLFSDDNTMCAIVPALVDPCFYPEGQTSHILTHVAAKNYIMSKLRGQGYVKSVGGSEENVNQWDILDIYELRDAANYYVISQVYFNLSDDPEDQYWAKYVEFKKKFDEAFALGRLRVDLNEDGQVDAIEKRPIKSTRWAR